MTPRKRRLRDKQVLAIRDDAAKGVAFRALALSYAVSPALISSICRGETYKDVGGPRLHKRPARGIPKEIRTVRGPAEEMVAAGQMTPDGRGGYVVKSPFRRTNPPLHEPVQRDLFGEPNEMNLHALAARLVEGAAAQKKLARIRAILEER